MRDGTKAKINLISYKVINTFRRQIRKNKNKRFLFYRIYTFKNKFIILISLKLFIIPTTKFTCRHIVFIILFVYSLLSFRNRKF